MEGGREGEERKRDRN
uniref:Uncharacterized protein n=1 Tax=Arundo donax TaxID=35708 RepID=A0A0A8Z1H6_ARUDO